MLGVDLSNRTVFCFCFCVGGGGGSHFLTLFSSHSMHINMPQSYGIKKNLLYPTISIKI